jgi:hypothetical protein
MANSISEENSYLIKEKEPLFEQTDKAKEIEISLSALFKNTYPGDPSKNQDLQTSTDVKSLDRALSPTPSGNTSPALTSRSILSPSESNARPPGKTSAEPSALWA